MREGGREKLKGDKLKGDKLTVMYVLEKRDKRLLSL